MNLATKTSEILWFCAADNKFVDQYTTFFLHNTVSVQCWSLQRKKKKITYCSVCWSGLWDLVPVITQSPVQGFYDVSKNGRVLSAHLLRGSPKEKILCFWFSQHSKMFGTTTYDLRGFFFFSKAHPFSWSTQRRIGEVRVMVLQS